MDTMLRVRLQHPCILRIIYTEVDFIEFYSELLNNHHHVDRLFHESCQIGRFI